MLEPQKRTSASSQEPLKDSKSEELSQVLLLVNNLRRNKPELYRHIMGIIRASLKE
jgi:hypothetical protein